VANVVMFMLTRPRGMTFATWSCCPPISISKGILIRREKEAHRSQLRAAAISYPNILFQLTFARAAPESQPVEFACRYQKR